MSTPSPNKISTDIHVDINHPELSVLFPDQRRIDDSTIEYVNELAQSIKLALESNKNAYQFMVSLPTSGDRYRIQLVSNSKYAARKIGEPKKFNELNIPAALQELLLDTSLTQKGGLVLICGAPGSGKTSTAVAMVDEILGSRGGYCLTVEDPPEFNISGFRGSGFCEQLDVTDLGITEGIVRSLRIFPSKPTESILFFGEIRRQEEAKELLKVALDGKLVIATIHSKSIQACIQRLTFIAGGGSDKEWRFLLSMSLRLIVHQSIPKEMAGPIPVFNVLSVDEVVSSIISSGLDANLSDAIKSTMNKLEARKNALMLISGGVK